MPASAAGVLIFVLLYFPACALICGNKKVRPEIQDLILAVPACGVLAYSFCIRWKMSEFSFVPSWKVLKTVSLILAAASVYGFGRLISMVREKAMQTVRKSAPEDTKLRTAELILLMVIAVVTMLICTKSSPLYPFNDWVDANAYFTVGKSILKGLVPYRDLFEHKGPLLYLIHAAAAMISYDSFIGVFFIETVCCFFFLLYSYKTLRIWFDSDVMAVMPVIAALVYSAAAFSHGDSVEELCFPLLAYAMYVSFRSLHSEQLPSGKECFVIGLTSACVLWMKYTILGFYFGWIVIPAYLCLKWRNPKKLLSMIAMIALGVVCASLPILMYFGVNGALGDLWEVYFYDNIFVYGTAGGESAGLMSNLYYGFLRIIIYNLPAILLICFGTAWCVSAENRYVALQYLFMTAGTALLVYCGTRRYAYYSLIFGAFAPAGAAFLHTLLNKKKIFRSRAAKSCIVSVCAVMIMVLCSSNVSMMKYKKSDLPQFKVKELIDQYGIESPTLLNYGFLDGGFYTAAGITPNVKYFYMPNIPLDEISEQQQYYTDQGITDFIVTTRKNAEFELYDLVDSFSYYYENTKRTYSLYVLKSDDAH